jgi:hypothetical protein
MIEGATRRKRRGYMTVTMPEFLSAASLATRVEVPPMILAYHCIFGFYGLWLPNDP